MKGDFSRDTFDPAGHFTRVLLQQGRVSLDADFNEQASILLHRLQAFSADLLGQGPYLGAGPAAALGFQPGASDTAGDFMLGAGRYYVNGLLVENDTPCSFLTQPDYPVPASRLLAGVSGSFLAYLDVWERHVTAREAPGIREVALGGPDTASRAEVVWQVKLLPVAAATGKNVAVDFHAAAVNAGKAAPAKAGAAALIQDFPITLSLAALRARARQIPPDTDACSIPPASVYRGLENQLYRVEIRQGGQITDHPTFIWSRENGSVQFPILGIQADAGASTTRVSLATLGRDQRLGLTVGDWVEIVDDASVLQNLAEPLLQVVFISPDDPSVTLGGLRATANRGDDPALHPLLRRWDQAGAALPITEGSAAVDADWITLEDGVQVLFETPTPPGITFYRTGDYWLIPARVATGDVEWPQTAGLPRALPPRGVHHQFAPLARISVVAGAVTTIKDVRSSFEGLAKPVP